MAYSDGPRSERRRAGRPALSVLLLLRPARRRLRLARNLPLLGRVDEEARLALDVLDKVAPGKHEAPVDQRRKARHLQHRQRASFRTAHLQPPFAAGSWAPAWPLEESTAS